MTASTQLVVPPLRLGNLLRARRLELGLGLEELALRSGGSFTRSELADVEAGRALLDDLRLLGLTRLYAIDMGELVPSRSQLVIDLDEGRIAVADHAMALPDHDPVDDLLASYLALVYSLRKLPVGTPIAFRDVDIDVLGTALERRGTDIEFELRRLVREPTPDVGGFTRLFRRRLLVPAAGVFVGLTTIGAVVLLPDSAPGARNSVKSVGTGPTAVDVEIGQAVTLGRSEVSVLAVPEVEIADAVTLDHNDVPTATTELGDAGTLERDDLD